MGNFHDTSLNDGQKILKKISDSIVYESLYHSQSLAAYDIYSATNRLVYSNQRLTYNRLAEFQDLLQNNRRANIYYANVETLKGLILPQVPSLSVTLNQTKKTENNKENKDFYDTCANILSCMCNQIVAEMGTSVWDAFKLDYIVTGRGVLWVSTKPDGDQDKVYIDNVRWQDFAMDTKPTWQSVGWVARRHLFTKPQFLERFDVSESKITSMTTLDTIYGDVSLFDSFGDQSSYIEVWEYWDKKTLTQYYASKQYNVEDSSDKNAFIIEKTEFKNADADYFFPTPQPPVMIYNGMNLIPFSDVWNYISELNEMTYITQKRAALVKTLHLRGYTDTARASVINTLSNATSDYGIKEEDDNIVSVPGFTPSPQDPLIYYVDNNPRLQLLDFLQKEYDVLSQRIYTLTGISEQMRNVTAGDDDETATSIRLKSKFGSRRLKEHQQRLLNYWTAILKTVLHRISQSYGKVEFSEVFTYNFRDSNQDELQEVIFKQQEIHKQLQEIQSQIEMQQQQMPPQQAVQQGGFNA
jgi:hypothetical protein